MPTGLFLVFYQRLNPRLKSIYRLHFDMTRLFCDFPLVVGTNIDLPKETSRHIHVLRLSPGNEIVLFNGTGGEYPARITALDKTKASVNILSHDRREVELPYKITLAQALPEAGKMDWIIEKAVELGASVIQPLAARRSVVRLNAERAEKRLARWLTLVTAASEQCGRNTLLQIGEPLGFNAFIENSGEPLRVIFTPRASETLAAWAAKQAPQSITIMIGPEGGFSPEEEELAIQNGVIPLSMGSRILRTETAGLAAIAAINALWDKDHESS